MDLGFYKNKRVLVTGHTGFKGSWMTTVLVKAGAKVTGYSLKRRRDPSLFDLSGMESQIRSEQGDVRDLTSLCEIMNSAKPEIVIHMAAQPIVRESYQDPIGTYETNVMGTLNVCEAIRRTPSVCSFINVTTDKVYLNREWVWGYREDEELNGFDPYSNSKSCSELVTSCYTNSFFTDAEYKTRYGSYAEAPAVSTCRAGNVIGGGDFAKDRIIPDCIRAVQAGKEIIVRNPYSTRPYQHVLEPVIAYLMIAKEQFEDRRKAGSYNIGPDDSDCWTTGRLVDQFCNKWNQNIEEKNLKSFHRAFWINQHDGGPHEANFLKLDCSKAKTVFGWKPVWSIDYSMDKIIEWTECYLSGGDISKIMDKQIEEYLHI